MSGDPSRSSVEVDLGFLEEAEPWRLLSPQFPSKVGGKPAWLSQTGLPPEPGLECDICRLPLAFLLQVPMAETDLEAMATHETEDNEVFQRFKKRIAPEPHQVVRYSRGGSPLWVSFQHIPCDQDIPACTCGAKRTFEFQTDVGVEDAHVVKQIVATTSAQ
ncbi:Programmed cell death protein 2 [Liparis tanakae]|uniref:Programmed cell death protein 2 n=1 Tax=Liparis tanakae TaxID=230148 RepID=A0A4Z2GSK7_9TELE|nr:Programmed cell death protein 2 [Liparis tanakae]